MANDHKFAKVSSAKLFCSILNNMINVQICQSLFHQLCFCSEFAKVCTHQSFPLYGIVGSIVVGNAVHVLVKECYKLTFSFIHLQKCSDNNV